MVSAIDLAMLVNVVFLVQEDDAWTLVVHLVPLLEQLNIRLIQTSSLNVYIYIYIPKCIYIYIIYI